VHKGGESRRSRIFRLHEFGQVRTQRSEIALPGFRASELRGSEILTAGTEEELPQLVEEPSSTMEDQSGGKGPPEDKRRRNTGVTWVVA
jgi:hypothetical protein